jgi:uncharacterized protein (DUF1778 family)
MMVSHRKREPAVARLTLRLPEDLHRRLRSTAERTGSSLNQLIVAALSQALAWDELIDQEEGSVREQVQHVRWALGELAVEMETPRLPPDLRPSEDLPDTDTLRRSMPELVPPLSVTIRADREDRI